MGDFHPHAYSMAAVTLGITPLFQAATMRYRKGQTVCQLSLFFFFSLSLFLRETSGFLIDITQENTDYILLDRTMSRGDH